MAICVVVLFLAIPLQAQTTSKTIEEELIKLENQWSDAMVKMDLAFLGRHLSDEYVEWSPYGTSMTKAELIASLKSGDLKVLSMVVDDIKVRVYADTAVVTGRTILKDVFKGMESSGQYRWTDIWAKIAGRWQCVAAHASQVAQE
jgi:hypothetical protein